MSEGGGDARDPMNAITDHGAARDLPHADVTEFLHEAFEWLPVGLLLVDADGAIVLTNRELERIFGYTRRDLIGQSVDALVPDGARAGHAQLRRAFAAAPRARPLRVARELSGLRHDGSEVPLEITLIPLRIRDALLVLAAVTDITERRRLQLELQASIDERTEFEQLVGELGAEFTSLRADEVDRHITEALGRVVRTLNLDRSALFVVEDGGDFVNTHQWTRPGWAPPPPRVSAQSQFPWLLAQVRAGETARFATLDQVPDAADREALRRIGTQSGVTVPLLTGGQVRGAVSFATIRHARDWPPAVVNRLQVVASIFGSALARKRADDTLARTLADHAALRDRLLDENTYLHRELRVLTGAPAIVGHSAGMRRVLQQVRQVAPTDTTVLVHGEIGTGKALLAARIHELSTRRDRAMVRVNCGGAPGAWTFSELFGSETGPYRQGGSRHIGWLELADRSTVFLDDVAELPLDTQATLAQVLRDRQIRPVGSTRPVVIDVRIIAATRRDLTQCIANGTFREDLYYHLNVFSLHVPPLRERPEDVPLLVWHFVDEFADVYGKAIDVIDTESLAALERYSWPGNARELRNLVERAMIAASGRQLRIPIPAPTADQARSSEKLATVEKEHIRRTLDACSWRVEGRNGTAARLGLTPRALAGRMAKLGIRRPPG